MTNTQSKVPQLRFPEFSGEWKGKRLAHLISSMDSGWSPECENYNASEGEWGVLKTSCVLWDGYLATANKKLPSNLIPRPNLEVATGDILVTRAGPMNRVGVVAYVSSTRNKLMVSDKIIRIRINKETDGNFVSFLLSGSAAQRYLAARKSGLAKAQANISQSILNNMIVNLPKKNEQVRITTFLFTVDKKISLLKQKHEQLVQYKKGIMQQLFSQQLRFKDDDEQDFPDWEFRKGNKIFDVISDKKHNSDLPILAITQEHGAIPRDLINYQVQVTDTSVSGYKVVEKGDYIISLRSFQGGIEYSNYKGICSPAYIILRPLIEISDDFYRYYLKTNNFIQEMKRRLEGIRDGKILSYKYFSEINLPSPSVDEQNKIADFLGVIDQKINLAQQQVEQTQAYKQGLLQQMFV